MNKLFINKNIKILCTLIFMSIVLTSCSDDENQPKLELDYAEKSIVTNEKEYIFGIHPLHNPKRLHQIFGPVIDYLTKNIPGAKFKVEASRNYAAYDKKLYAGKFHFSLPNPFQTVNSLKHGYTVFGKMSDDDNFRGIFLVRKDSGIKTVSDLKGKAVSFPAPTALAATMMPQYYLYKNGLNVMKDIKIRYVGSQESSVMNVMLRDTVAGATWPPPWNALSKERPELSKELTVIWETKPLLNNGLVARNDVDKNILNKVEKLLFNLHTHKEGKLWLEKMELSRFEAATNNTYQPVVKFLDEFHKTVRPIK